MIIFRICKQVKTHSGTPLTPLILLVSLSVDVRRWNPSSIIHAVTTNKRRVAAHGVEPRSTRDIHSTFVSIHTRTRARKLTASHADNCSVVSSDIWAVSTLDRLFIRASLIDKFIRRPGLRRRTSRYEPSYSRYNDNSPDFQYSTGALAWTHGRGEETLLSSGWTVIGSELSAPNFNSSVRAEQSRFVIAT